MPEIAGRLYRALIGSDAADRDGMHLELWDGSEQLLEVFYPDVDGVDDFHRLRSRSP